MNELVILIPMVLNFIIWFLHLNATHAMSITKLLGLILFSIIPIVNIITIIIYIIFQLIATATKEKDSDYDDSGIVLGIYKNFDPETISGKILIYLTKNR